MDQDIVVPLFKHRWCTRAVLEGLSAQYEPRRIIVICPETEIGALECQAVCWFVENLEFIPEESFFNAAYGLSKNAITSRLDLRQSLYSPGWFYQQILKFGASCGVDNLSEDYLVWDSDLLPVKAWPVLEHSDEQTASSGPIFKFALLQHKSRGNPGIVGAWRRWIECILEVDPVEDPVGTFVPHHMWFNTGIIAEIYARLGEYYASSEPWPVLMMESANEFGSFSEFWTYCSWLAQHHPRRLAYHPYDAYGASTERFFDDGSGKFAVEMKRFHGMGNPAPDYRSVMEFVDHAYGRPALPSSLSFESNPRHMKKGESNMHLEELRSRWHMTEQEYSEISEAAAD